eukprot:2886618-Amphidinium_carterae.1
MGHFLQLGLVTGAVASHNVSVSTVGSTPAQTSEAIHSHETFCSTTDGINVIQQSGSCNDPGTMSTCERQEDWEPLRDLHGMPGLSPAMGTDAMRKLAGSWRTCSKRQGTQRRPLQVDTSGNLCTMPATA